MCLRIVFYHFLDDQHCDSMLRAMRRKTKSPQRTCTTCVTLSLSLCCSTPEQLHRNSCSSHACNAPASVLRMRRFVFLAPSHAGLSWVGDGLHLSHTLFLSALKLACPSHLPAPLRILFFQTAHLLSLSADLPRLAFGFTSAS